MGAFPKREEHLIVVLLQFLHKSNPKLRSFRKIFRKVDENSSNWRATGDEVIRGSSAKLCFTTATASSLRIHIAKLNKRGADGLGNHVELLLDASFRSVAIPEEIGSL